MDVTNASRTLLLSLKTLQWHPPLLRFFSLRPSILPRIVSSSEVYGHIHANQETPLTGVPIAGIVGDQQAALVGNKCLRKGEAKNTYGTGSFVLFNTGEAVVRSENGLISTIAYQPGPGTKPVYALEGSIAVAGSAIKWCVFSDGIGRSLISDKVERSGQSDRREFGNGYARWLGQRYGRCLLCHRVQWSPCTVSRVASFCRISDVSARIDTGTGKL
jgi:glycerol kinase